MTISVQEFLKRKKQEAQQQGALSFIRERASIKVSPLDVARQIGQGIGKFAKDIVIPQRGFSEEELKTAKPTFKEGLIAAPRTVAEIATGLGSVYGALPRSQKQREAVSKFVQTPIGGKLADLGEKIAEFSKPKTAGEAKAMRAGDIATLLPAGSLKGVKAIDAVSDAKNVANAFEGFEDLTTKVLNRLKGKTTTSKQEILNLTNMPELKQAERDLIRKAVDDFDDVNPLTQEARKYKSAEEFVKAQGDNYHGTSVKNAEQIIKDGFKVSQKGNELSGISLTKDMKIADKWAVNDLVDTNGETIVSRVLPNTKLIKDSILFDYMKKNGLNKNTMADFNKAIDYYKKLGFDGIDYAGKVNNEIRIWNVDKIKPVSTKSQLTDFYNKAVKGSKIPVQEFANRVKTELLPLEANKNSKYFNSGTRNISLYENITLPDELRGPIANYTERIYESPIKTSAGNVHFGGQHAEVRPENYFAHSRIEDLPATDGSFAGDFDELNRGDTRRVIELQSDLFQKGRLEGEAPRVSQQANGKWGVFTRNSSDPVGPQFATEAEAKAFANKDIAKLEPYRNTWHERLIREEVKQAAKDGKTKLQFPTGETAMKIEGLGVNEGQWEYKLGRSWARFQAGTSMKVGEEIRDASRSSWIITDVLGDGKFKAVPKDNYIDPDSYSFTPDSDDAMLIAGEVENMERLKETFDISGKVDTNNPIYKFYEKEVGKYLKNKYNAQLITDPQGVKWWEVNVAKDIAKQPVEAFGAFAGVEQDEEGKVSFDPTKAALGALGAGVIKKGVGKERGFIQSTKAKIPQATKIAGQYISRSTDDLAIKAKNLIKDDIAKAERLAITGSDENAVAIASELIKKYGDDAVKATDEVQAGMLYDKAAEIANAIAPKLTEQGRAIQAASILGRLTPEGQLRFAAREIQRYNQTAARKIPELTGEQAKFISEEMKAIQGMADGQGRAERFQKLQDYIKDLVPTPLIKKVIAVWKAGLLTGIKTSGLNLFSNLSHSVTETIKDIPATAVDSVASLFTGQRTKTFQLPKGEAIKKGFDKGVRYFKTGFDERNIAQKLDYDKVNFGKGKVAKAFQTYTDTVFRVMGSSDQPFYYGALARSVADQATAQGLNRGLRGNALKEFTEKLIQNPTEEMMRYAVSDASTAVFQNQTYLGKAAKSLQNIPLVGEIVVPFGRTPSAVATQILNYTPAGIVSEIASQITKGKFDQRLFSEAVGRGLTGTGALYIGNELAKKGLVALDRPTTEKEQKLWELEGRKPNSVKIGDKWRSPIVLGPAGNLLLIGAHFNKAFQESGSPSEAMSKAVLGSGKSFTEQTFLTGINSAANALNDPERFAESYLGGLVASTIPTLVSDVARATDPLERRTENIQERLKARVPGLRKQLEPQVDVLGQERESVGNPLEILADPTRPFPERKSPVISELRRLTDEGFEVSPTLLGDKKGFKGLSQKENTQLWKRAGEITNEKLNNLFRNEKYLRLEDDEKGKIVEDFVDKAKLIARVEIAIELTDGLIGEELKAKLSELKTDGLLTREVYNKYIELR